MAVAWRAGSPWAKCHGWPIVCLVINGRVRSLIASIGWLWGRPATYKAHVAGRRIGATALLTIY